MEQSFFLKLTFQEPIIPFFFFNSKKKKVEAQTTVYRENLLFPVTRSQSCCSAGSAHLLEGTDQWWFAFPAPDLWNGNIAQGRDSTATVAHRCIYLSGCSSPYVKSSNTILSDPISLRPNKFPCWVLQNETISFSSTKGLNQCQS